MKTKYSFHAEQSLTHELMFGIMDVSLPWFVLILEVLGMEEVKDRDYYAEKIKEIIDQTHDRWILEHILYFVEGMTKEGD